MNHVFNRNDGQMCVRQDFGLSGVSFIDHMHIFEV